MLETIPFTHESEEARTACMLLWQAHSRGELPIEEFLTDCAYLALTYGFEALSPHICLPRPQELLDYDQMSYDKKNRVEHTFWRQPPVYFYCEEKHKAKVWNKAAKEWLEEILKYLPQEDMVNRQKIVNRLTEFAGGQQVQTLTSLFGGSQI